MEFKEEVEFWDRFASGAIYTQDFMFRKNPNNELRDRYKPYIKPTDRILDVGCGLWTVMGRNLNGKRLNMTCVDLLGKHYKDILKKHNLPDIDDVQECSMMELSSRFPKESFDFVNCENAMDHCDDPVKGFNEIVSMCAPGGTVYLFHEINEGTNEGWQGMHQTNLYSQDGDFWCANKAGQATNLTAPLKNFSKKITEDKGWITVILKRND